MHYHAVEWGTSTGEGEVPGRASVSGERRLEIKHINTN
jgi:hypothetical protein